MYNLWLDDFREAPKDGRDWLVARCYQDAVDYFIQYVTKGFDIISLDHDLGEDKTGYDFLKFILFFVRDYPEHLDNTTILCHSANPVGKANIEATVTNFFQYHYTPRS